MIALNILGYFGRNKQNSYAALIICVCFFITAMECPANEEYSSSASPCQASCVDPNPDCDLPSVEACVCLPGHVRSDTRCVLTTECGCYYKGVYLKVSLMNTITSSNDI